MKYKALADILVNSKRYKTGATFEADAETGELLEGMGWAEKVETKKPEKKAKKAETKPAKKK